MAKIAYNHNKLELRGQQFNRLLVLEEVGRDRENNVLWKCRCNCGNETIVPASRLRNGHTGSCGCLKRQRIIESRLLPKGEAAFNEFYRNYRGNARRKGLVFDISEDTFRKLITQECFYCGTPPRDGYYTKRNRNGNLKRNGIDRVDNERGYVGDNIVTCCRHCNRVKGTMDVGEFLGLVHKIARKHNLI